MKKQITDKEFHHFQFPYDDPNGVDNVEVEAIYEKKTKKIYVKPAGSQELPKESITIGDALGIFVTFQDGDIEKSFLDTDYILLVSERNESIRELRRQVRKRVKEKENDV